MASLRDLRPRDAGPVDRRPRSCRERLGNGTVPVACFWHQEPGRGVRLGSGSERMTRQDRFLFSVLLKWHRQATASQTICHELTGGSRSVMIALHDKCHLTTIHTGM